MPIETDIEQIFRLCAGDSVCVPCGAELRRTSETSLKGEAPGEIIIIESNGPSGLNCDRCASFWGCVLSSWWVFGKSGKTQPKNTQSKQMSFSRRSWVATLLSDGVIHYSYTVWASLVWREGFYKCLSSISASFRPSRSQWITSLMT